MVPTLLGGDVILVNKCASGVRLPVIYEEILDNNPGQRGVVTSSSPQPERRRRAAVAPGSWKRSDRNIG